LGIGDGGWPSCDSHPAIMESVARLDKLTVEADSSDGNATDLNWLRMERFPQG